MRAQEKRRKPSPRLIRVLAENVRGGRASLGFSQESLANLCGFHRTFIGSIERGERNVSLSTLETLANALNVSVPQLLTKGDLSETS